MRERDPRFLDLGLRDARAAGAGCSSAVAEDSGVAADSEPAAGGGRRCSPCSSVS